MQGVPKPLRRVQAICVALLLAVGIQSAAAFALLGPYAPFMTTPMMYRLPDAIGGPMKMGEGYRWNVPVITYGYDQSFLDYFGSNGVTAVDAAVQILNALPPSSQIILTNYPFTSQRENFPAVQEDLAHLQSAALVELVEQMGLMGPHASVYNLLDFSFNPANDSAVYDVDIRNYDPVSLAPSMYVNGSLLDYTVAYNLPSVPYSIFRYIGGSSNALLGPGPYLPPGYANAQEYATDPKTVGRWAVADYEPSPTQNLLLPDGMFLANGLTRDDAGGLAYLLSTNTIALENLLPGARGAGTNAGNFVNRALRPGVGKITFQRIDPISTNPQVFPIVTNQYVDSYIANGVVEQQTLERVITQPDILFTARYIGADSVSRTGTTNWVNNGAPGHDGPGVIQPPIAINFNRFGPSFQMTDQNYLSTSGSMAILPSWGSFDGTTNPPIIFPIPPAVTNCTEFHFLLNSPGNITPLTNGFTWHLQGAPNALFSLQTSANLADWTTIGPAITNLGGTFTYFDFVIQNTSQRYFRTIPQ